MNLLFQNRHFLNAVWLIEIFKVLTLLEWNQPQINAISPTVTQPLGPPRRQSQWVIGKALFTTGGGRTYERTMTTSLAVTLAVKVPWRLFIKTSVMWGMTTSRLGGVMEVVRSSCLQNQQRKLWFVSWKKGISFLVKGICWRWSFHWTCPSGTCRKGLISS